MSELSDNARWRAAKQAVKRWEKEFRAAARADNYDVFRQHLLRLELRGSPRGVLKSTIHQIYACVAFSGVDHKFPNGLLSMQQYKPDYSSGARYSLTFDLGGGHYSRLLVDSEFSGVDLADLYDYPRWDGNAAGYSQIWITNIDGASLTSEQIESLERVVEGDLRFDYSEDELDFWFRAHESDDYLYVGLCDVERHFDER